MTYCVAMRLDAGLVFLSDSRTNAGVDQISTFRKMSVYENPGERVIVLMSSGNLSIAQSVMQVLSDQAAAQPRSIWTVASMYEAAQIVGEAIRAVHQRDAKMLEEFRIDFNTSFIVGGQIKGEKCRLFQIYSAGNFIESVNESMYFQIGEAKYGKPIIDRVITRHTPLDEAAKCALISMDSTLRSNISVGLPLDLLVYEANKFTVTRFVSIDHRNRYFQMIRDTWGQKLKRVFEEIDDPVWDPAPGQASDIALNTAGSEPLRVDPPANLTLFDAHEQAQRQTLAQQGTGLPPQ
jgi:putative proteasome-type protease